MFTTKVLGSFKNALPSIHQPLPLTRRESQKLLNSLKSSFRHKLDKEHGWLPDDTTTPPRPRHPGTAHNPQESQPSLNASVRPTDRHLSAILDNPLFNYTHGASLGSDGTMKGLGPDAARDPMDVFDRAVARGMMTVRAAAGCLKSKRAQIVRSGAISVKDAMAASGAGSRTVQWLRASGNDNPLDHFTIKILTGELMHFLVAEGLEEVAWAWADRLLTGQGEGTPSQQAWLAGLLIRQLVDAKASVVEDGRLDDSYTTVLQADSLWQANLYLDRILYTPWRKLSWLSTVQVWNRPRPSAALFDSFVATADHIGDPLLVDRAHLKLHHPTDPSYEQALGILQDDQQLQKALHPPSSLTGRAPAFNAARIISMGIDTVGYLTQIGRQEDAESILEMLQSNFSDKVWRQTGKISVGLPF